MDQSDLFENDSAPEKAYVPEPRHVRNRLAEMLEKMQAAEQWPWDPVMVELYREKVWPYLYERLPDANEAAQWRQRIEAEIERLDRTV
jgi:hypothetical protein